MDNFLRWLTHPHAFPFMPIWGHDSKHKRGHVHRNWRNQRDHERKAKARRKAARR